MTYSSTGLTYTYESLNRQFFRNTCCHFQKVVGPNGHVYMALWNGLSYWLKILEFTNGVDMYGGVKVVRELQAEPEEDEEGLYLPNAGLYLALEAGYKVVVDD